MSDEYGQGQDEIPAGDYRGRGIAGSEQYGVSSNGNEQVAIDLTLLDLNRTVTTVLNFSEKAERYAIDRLKALGWPGGVDDLRDIDANEVVVRIKYETYEDPNTGDVKRSMRAEIVTGGRFAFKEQMDDSQKRGFFSRLKSISAATQGASRAAPRQAQRNGPAAPGGYPDIWDEEGAGGGSGVKI